ncbi:unnamed protein product [Closterium sp. NIES-64]|nr:unnamed protein product [Closterium sp. Yama58-4]CAI5957409.1 unnamed protein product [Closterium sp. NIES-64]CAI5994043.1 unnamed protein product [Closterium sp. NIES-65]
MANAAEVPTDVGRHLRACLRCSLLKTYDQFYANGCENCPFFEMDGDEERVKDATTANFSGIISCMDPAGSWAARWLRISRAAPGCYAISVTGNLTDDLQSICESNNVRYVPRSNYAARP